MDLYNRNLNIIKNTRTNLYNGIMNYKENGESKHNIEIASIPTRDGNNTIMIYTNSQQYRLNSIYKPITEAEKWVQGFVYQNIDIVTSMYGLGNGVFLRELLNKANNGDLIIVYEPSIEIFLHVMENYDITDIIGNKSIILAVVGANEIDFKVELEKATTWSNVETQIVCMHPQYEKIFLEDARTFLTIIDENNKSILINRNTVAYFSRDTIENTLKNLRYIKDSNTVLDLVGVLPQDVPAIIVSAGPSLDKNIDLLKQAKGKAVIVATDTAMKFLYAHGIVPDFFVTLDAMKPESYLDDLRFMEVPMFTKVESNWKILKKHKASKIYYNCQEYMDKLFRKAGKIISNYESGGSVATGAFSICAALRFNTIILIGQDLAYEGDRTHAGTLTDRIRGEEEGIRYVEGIHGGKVKTRHDWYLYLKWFEQAIEEVKSFTTVIDATEGGAKIQGTVIMNLQEAIDKYCVKDINCDEIMKNKSKTLSDDEVSKIYGYMQDGIVDFETVKKLAQRAKTLCEQILSKLKNNGDFDEKLSRKARELGIINASIEESMVYCLINEYASELTIHILKDIYKLSNDDGEDRINTFKRAKAFYEAIISGASAIKPMLEEAVNSFWDSNENADIIGAQRVVLIMQVGMMAVGIKERVMQKISGKTILQHSLERIQQVKLIDDITIAGTINEEDDDIINEAQRLGIRTFRGSEYDILSGYYYASKESRADIVVRVNLNSPFIDSSMIDHMIEYYKNNDFKIVTNTGAMEDRTFPRGLEVEVFSAKDLLESYRSAKEAYQRNQVTPYLYEKGPVGNYRNDIDYSNYCWTLDTEMDMGLIFNVYKNLYHGEKNFSMKDIIELLKQHPEWEINKK